MVAFNLENLKFKMQQNARLFTNYKLSLFLKSIHELVVQQNFQGKCLKG